MESLMNNHESFWRPVSKNTLRRQIAEGMNEYLTADEQEEDSPLIEVADLFSFNQHRCAGVSFFAHDYLLRVSTLVI